MSMTPITNVPLRAPSSATEPRVEKQSGPDFGSVLGDALTEAGSLEKKANDAAAAFAKGDGGIHEVMIAQEKASIAVRYAVTLKNKALEAYREILNTQI